MFDEIVDIMPEGVYLTSLKQTGARFELRGVAQSSTRVSAFMRNIDASEWLATWPCRSCRHVAKALPTVAPSSRCLQSSAAR